MSNATGDANGDDQVDGDDLAVWQDQFGTSASVAVVSTVEEAPAAAVAVVESVESDALDPQVTTSFALAVAPSLAVPSGISGDALEAVFAEEAVEPLMADVADDLPTYAATGEQSAQDEALASLMQEGEDADATEDALALVLQDLI